MESLSKTFVRRFSMESLSKTFVRISLLILKEVRLYTFPGEVQKGLSDSLQKE
jgi:hypothetical protein